MADRGIRIVAAAINHNGRIWQGRRHALIMRDIWDAEGDTYIPQSEQGFVDSSGRFVDRFCAGAIAFAAGQTKTLKDHLLSEDIW